MASLSGSYPPRAAIAPHAAVGPINDADGSINAAVGPHAAVDNRHGSHTAGSSGAGASDGARDGSGSDAASSASVATAVSETGDGTVSIVSSDNFRPSYSFNDSQNERARLEASPEGTDTLNALGHIWLVGDDGATVTLQGSTGTMPEFDSPSRLRVRIEASREQVLEKLRERRLLRMRSLRLQLRMHVRVVGRLVTLHRLAAERTYAPGGLGQVAAARHFDELARTHDLQAAEPQCRDSKA